MRNIIIYSKTEAETFTLPVTKNLSNGGEFVGKEIQMAAGNIVIYRQGYRPTLSATWDWFPADLLSRLIQELRTGGWFKVTYPDLDGTDRTGYFKISASNMSVFSYRNGIPMWRGLTLSFVSRDIIKAEV